MGNLRLGDVVPMFELPASDGSLYSLKADMAERPGWRFLVFFRGTWCGVCNLELKDIEENQHYFEERGVHFVALSTDSQENSKEMKDKQHLTYPILSNVTREIMNRYGVHYHDDDAPYEDHGVHGETAYYLLDEEGRVLFQQQQTSPYGRPDSRELRKIVQFIKKSLK